MTEKVLYVSGHRTDGPEREEPRFPESRVDAVSREIREYLRRWGVGPGWTVVSGGARGADLLAAREAAALGARVRLCLALPEEEFIARSVMTDHPAPALDWVDLFRQVVKKAQVTVLPAARRPDAASSSEVFARANEWMLDEVRGAAELYALLVWNGMRGSIGGTWELIDQLAKMTAADRIHVIDPTLRAYEHRQDSPGPKRILALDGGGLRGVISLEILGRIQHQLRDHYGDKRLVLADYFDYIAGTSTGAIIATGLALGKPVEEIRNRYQLLGAAAFRRSPLAWARLARYGVSSIRAQLDEFLGTDLTLGDPRLQTLLMIVLHNSRTDSPWLLSNCTRAKYNRPDRLLPQHQDRNLDLPLIPLVRGSTAAPTYFPSQKIDIGSRSFAFRDGGVTAFNSPALICAVMATLPAYQLQWRKGVDDLLVVSVGTGFSAATGRERRLALVEAAAELGQLAAVFMNGAAFSQDLLCRVIGDCRFGRELDREVGRLEGYLFDSDAHASVSATVHPTGDPDESDFDAVPAVGEYFSYVRYDADLSDGGLKECGIEEKRWRSVRKLDAVSEVKNLVTIGANAANDVNVDAHFRGFLDRRT